MYVKCEQMQCKRQDVRALPFPKLLFIIDQEIKFGEDKKPAVEPIPVAKKTAQNETDKNETKSENDEEESDDNEEGEQGDYIFQLTF